MSASSDEEHEFMLAEYQTLRELRESSVRLGEARVTSFLTLLSAAILGAGFSAGVFGLPNQLTLLVLAAVAAVGCHMFVRVVESEIAVVEYTRGMNWLRNYFVDKHSKVALYTSLSLNDDHPSFGGGGRSRDGLIGAAGLSGVVWIINGMLFGLLAAVAAVQVPALSGVDPLQFGVAALVLTFVLESIWYFWRKGKHNKSYVPRFSTPA